MSDTVRVYVNGRGVDAPSGASCLDAVRLMEPDEADAIAAGRRAIADSRGLAIASDTTVHGGAIYRTISNRARSAGDA